MAIGTKTSGDGRGCDISDGKSVLMVKAEDVIALKRVLMVTAEYAVAVMENYLYRYNCLFNGELLQ